MAKTLVAYFSWSNTTTRAAERIAETIGAELFRIEPEKPYPKAYGATAMKGLIQKLTGARPKIKNQVKNFDAYDRIVLGMPIWWYDCPAILCSFVSDYDFAGKKIYAFCTHGGSGPSKSTETLKKACKTGKITEVIDGNSLTEARIRAWLEA